MSKYIIEVDDNAVANGCYSIVGTNNVLVCPNGLDKLQKYEEPVEKLEEENPWPQIADKYYCISGNNVVSEHLLDGCGFGRAHMRIGNCFRTKEEAEFMVERLKVLAEMRKFAEPFDAKWDGNTPHCIILSSVNDKHLEVHHHYLMRGGEFYFESKEKAEECIKAVGEDRIKKYYLGVE